MDPGRTVDAGATGSGQRNQSGTPLDPNLWNLKEDWRHSTEDGFSSPQHLCEKRAFLVVNQDHTAWRLFAPLSLS